MPSLNQDELNCLREIARPSNPLGKLPCFDDSLHHLESLGLIEQTSALWLPLTMVRSEYHITPAGRSLLLQLGL